MGPPSPLFVYQRCCPVTKELPEELGAGNKDRMSLIPQLYLLPPTLPHMTSLCKACGQG